jgi:hypothetical protein
VFDAYAGLATRVVSDLGYWREQHHALALNRRPMRIAINAEQPDDHLRLRHHPPDRFQALDLRVEPVRQRGQHILLTGLSTVQAALHGFAYGEWEADTVAVLREYSARPIVVRTRPSHAPLNIPGTNRCTDRDIGPAIRRAWAVVCYTGNVGADALLHGVPVIAKRGPGAVYYRTTLEAIDSAAPLPAAARLRALSDIAYWQWTPDEFASGALWQHLCNEGVV